MQDQNQKASDSFIKKNPEIEIFDKNGRKIVLRKPKPFKQYELVRILGNDAAPSYIQMCIPLLWVEKVGDHILPAISKQLHIESLVDILDYAGIEAVNEKVLEIILEDAGKNGVAEAKK